MPSGRDAAFETAVLGRLRRGYRVFHLRALLGTRIELCYLFVRISFGSETNWWPSARHLRLRRAAEEDRRAAEEEANRRKDKVLERLLAENAQLMRGGTVTTDIRDQVRQTDSLA